MPDLTGGPTADETALLTRLGELFDEIDPVPDVVLEAARASFAWRTIDAELAELQDDSALTPLAGIRGHGDSRLLTFEAPAITVVVEVTEVGEERRLVGQVVPAGAQRVEIRHARITVAADVDTVGRFTVDHVPCGPVSIACASSDGTPTVTSWVSI
jgi:hypothetical protein